MVRTAEEVAKQIQCVLILNLGKAFRENELYKLHDDMEGENALRDHLAEAGVTLQQLLQMFPDLFSKDGSNRWSALNTGEYNTVVDAMQNGNKRGKRGGGGFGGRARGRVNTINPRISQPQTFKHNGRGGGSSGARGGHGAAFRPHNQFNRPAPPPPQGNFRRRSPTPSPPPQRRGFNQNDNYDRGNYESGRRDNRGYNDNFNRGNGGNNDYDRRSVSPYDRYRDFNNRRHSPDRRGSPPRHRPGNNYNYDSPRSHIDDRQFDANRGFFEDSVYDNYDDRRNAQRRYSPPRNRTPSVSPVRHGRDSFRGEQGRSYNAPQNHRPNNDRFDDERSSRAGPSHRSDSRSSVDTAISRPGSDSANTSFSAASVAVSLAPPPGLPIPPHLQKPKKETVPDDLAQLAERFKGSANVTEEPEEDSDDDSEDFESKKREHLARKVRRAVKEMAESQASFEDFFANMFRVLRTEFPGPGIAGKVNYLRDLKEEFPQQLANLHIDEQKRTIARGGPSLQRKFEPQDDQLMMKEVIEYIGSVTRDEFASDHIVEELVRKTHKSYQEVSRCVNEALMNEFRDKFVRVTRENRDWYVVKEPTEGVPTLYKHLNKLPIDHMPEYGLVQVDITRFLNFQRFSVRLVSMRRDFNKLNEELQQIMEENNRQKSYPLEAWHRDSAVVIQRSNGVWRRGVIVGVHTQLVKVYCIDVAETVMVAETSLRTMPVKFLDIPPFAFPVYLSKESDEYEELAIAKSDWLQAFDSQDCAPYYIQMHTEEKIDELSEMKSRLVDLFVTSLGQPISINRIQTP